MCSLPSRHVSWSEARRRPGIRQHPMRQFLDIVHRRLDGRADAVFAMTRRSIAFPPCSIVSPENPGSPTGVFFIRNRDPGSIRHGCALDTGRCRDIRRRNPWSGRILACSCLLPQFIEVCSLTNTQAGWLAVIPSPGGSRVPRVSFGSGAVERVGIESWAARDKM